MRSYLLTLYGSVLRTTLKFLDHLAAQPSPKLCLISNKTSFLCEMPPQCRTCKNLWCTVRDYRISFDCKVSDLEEATQRDCRICSLIQEGISNFIPHLGGPESIERISVWGPVNGQPSEGILWEVDIVSKDKPKLRLEFFAVDGKIAASKLSFWLS